MKQRNSFIVSLILIVTSVYFSSTAMAETVTAIQYNDEVSASEKAQKPIDVLLELISTENILVTLDPELVLHEERSAVLTAGTLLDRDVAVYKNKYQRLPSVLPLTRYMPKKVQATEEINATEVSAPVVEKVAAEKAVVDLSTSPAISESSGGRERNKPVFSDTQLAAMILTEGYANDVFYLYVHLPEDDNAKKQLANKLASLFEKTFQDQLEDKGFVRLPDAFKKLWLVRLGLKSPEFPGGYD
jgi:hypothetical protein